MSEINRDEIRHLCRLARLALTEEEMDRVGAELNRILAHFHDLQSLDTRDVPITSHAIPMNNVYREDVPAPSMPVEDVLGNAPDAIEGYFRTTLFVETEE